MPLLTDDERLALVNYKYKGADLSLTYKYVLSPAAQWCVDTLTPPWVAPNVITLAGLTVMLLAFAFTLIFNPSLQASNQPNWLCIYTGIAVLVYQTLDNMDGKQARKTNSSSALGMLFDHGCDAINSAITPVTSGACFGLGWLHGWTYLTTCVFFAFFFQTWEEYYVGEMNLPFFNGPSEGLLMTSAICLFSGLNPKGSLVWQTPVDISFLYPYCPAIFTFFGFSSEDSTKVFAGSLLLFFTNIWSLITVISQIVTVLRVAEKHGHSVVKALVDTIPFFVFFMSAVIWIKNTTLNIEGSSDGLWAALLFGSILVDLVTHLMVMHICHSPIKSHQRYFAFLVAALPGLAFLESDGSVFATVLSNQMTQSKCLRLLATLSALYSISNVYKICKESADALGIYLFVLGKKNKAM